MPFRLGDQSVSTRSAGKLLKDLKSRFGVAGIADVADAQLHQDVANQMPHMRVMFDDENVQSRKIIFGHVSPSPLCMSVPCEKCPVRAEGGPVIL